MKNINHRNISSRNLILYLRKIIKRSLVNFGYFSRPTFLIIGAQKSGTSSLHKYLISHSQIFPAQNKEINFFCTDMLFSKGENWYHSHFPLPYRLMNDGITFEATPEYLYYPRSAKRLFTYDPNIKLIVLLRNPIDRAYSHWNMFREAFDKGKTQLYERTREYDEVVRNWFDKLLSQSTFPSFEQSIDEEMNAIAQSDNLIEPSYLRRGFYFEQLIRYFNFFDRNQILIIDSREFANNTRNTLDIVYDFLGLPKNNQDKIKYKYYHKLTYVESISKESRILLSSIYQPHNEKLYELLNSDYQWH